MASRAPSSSPRPPWVRCGLYASLAGLVFLAACRQAVTLSSVALHVDGEGRSAGASEPERFHARGKLVCLAEEMKRLHGAEVPPVHEHLVGFRVEQEDTSASPCYYTLLRTPHSEALFVDERFGKRLLVLSGRVFPASRILDVSRCRWVRDGKELEVYYWCEVCAIRGFDPGPCDCCQGEVILREEEVAAGAPAEPEKTSCPGAAPGVTTKARS